MMLSRTIDQANLSLAPVVRSPRRRVFAWSPAAGLLVALAACGEAPATHFADGSTGQAPSGSTSAGDVEPSSSSGEMRSESSTTTTGNSESSATSGDTDTPLDTPDTEVIVGLTLPSEALAQRYTAVDDGAVLPSTPLIEDDIGGSWASPALLSGRRMLFRVTVPDGQTQVRLVDLNGEIPASTVRLDDDGIDGGYTVVSADDSVLYARNGAMYRVEAELSEDPAPEFLAAIPTRIESPFGPFPLAFRPIVDPQGRYAITPVLEDGESRLARVALDGSAVDFLPTGWASIEALTADGNEGYFRDFDDENETFRLFHTDTDGAAVGLGTEVLAAEATSPSIFLRPRPGAIRGGAVLLAGNGDARRIVYVAVEDGNALPPVELVVGDEAGVPNQSHWSADGRYLVLFRDGPSNSGAQIAEFGDGHVPELVTIELDSSDIEHVIWGPASSSLYVAYHSSLDNLVRVERTSRGDGFGQEFEPVFPAAIDARMRGFASTEDFLFVEAQLEADEGDSLYAVDLTGEQSGAPVRISAIPGATEGLRWVVPSPYDATVAYTIHSAPEDPEAQRISRLFLADPAHPEEPFELVSGDIGYDVISFLPPAE